MSGSQDGRPGRRAVLLGAGAGGVICIAAACSSAHGQAAVRAGTGSAAASPAASAIPSSGSVLAAVADVPVGGGLVVSGVLIVQPVAGTFKAYDASCPHKGVRVSAPVNGVSTCPAHHSTFAIADGARLSGPALKGLAELAIKTDEKEITLA